jgi:hypothetical protein
VCHAYCQGAAAPKRNCGAVAKIGLKAAPVLILQYLNIALTEDNRLIESAHLELLSSDVLWFEIDRIPNQYRKGRSSQTSVMGISLQAARRVSQPLSDPAGSL